ncbi:hypothetical protein J6590_014331 [Homalodisca vitripennis]|nr:hypothetical protein J6590_014331 [Homalodisca vitripennis]
MAQMFNEYFVSAPGKVESGLPGCNDEDVIHRENCQEGILCCGVQWTFTPVARMIKFWGIPLLTTGALTFDFSRDKRTPDTEYHLLLRAGLLSYRDLAFFLIALLDR